MIYLVYGSQTISVKSRIKRISKDLLNEIDNMNYVKFDFGDVTFFNVLDECSLVPLGYDTRVVVVENCNFLIKEDKKILEDKGYNALLEYINNPNPDCHLILSVCSKNVDNKSKLMELIKANGKIFAIADPTDNEWKLYVEQYITKNLSTEIDKDAVMELASRTKGDMALLYTSAAKLSLYTNHITYNDVVLMVEEQLDENIFQIYSELLNGKTNEALKVFNDLKIKNTEPIILISSLAKQFRLFHQTMFLINQGYNTAEIAEMLGDIKEVRVQIMQRQMFSISEKTVRKTLDDLYKLDLQIKSGLVDRYYAFELFLINFKLK